MKKIFSSCKNAVNWYLNALVETSAMCPSCMVPPVSAMYMYRTTEKVFENKHHSKAA